MKSRELTCFARILQILAVIVSWMVLAQPLPGQTLYDVVASISDRKRVTNQAGQVSAYLSSPNPASGTSSQTLPAGNPIDWQGDLGENPTESEVNGLGIGDRIKVLNQAVMEFDRLKPSYLNCSEAEVLAGGEVGILQPFTPGDFDPLPRATPENYHELLRQLGQQVRALRLISWPSAYMVRRLTDKTDVHEVVVEDDPEDENHDGDREARVEIRDSNNATVDEVSWLPTSIGPDNLDRKIGAASTVVDYMYDSRIGVSGSYSTHDSGDTRIPDPLRSQAIELAGNYPESAKVSSTAPGGDGTQIGGSVYILRRSHWHNITATDVSEAYDTGGAGYVVAGSSSSGLVGLFSEPHTAKISGSWVTTWSGSSLVDKTFVEDGYKYKTNQVRASSDAYHSDNHNHSYERNWKIGCAFHSVFRPTFTRGLDAAGMRDKLQTADGILADNMAWGELRLHPRPGLLCGVRLGPGLKGAGEGFVSCGSLESSSFYDLFSRYGAFWDSWHPMLRFDSTYSVQFAGSHSDYHVVYENDREARLQKLPQDALGWPYGDDSSVYDTSTLYHAWDSARLRQVAGRDLVADIEYNSSHYGGYTVKVYRRPEGSTSEPTAGQPLQTQGMTLIRTWSFSHPGAGTTAHPSDNEKLEVDGSAGEKFEIAANHTLPDKGLGFIHQTQTYAWYLDHPGTWFWSLHLKHGESELLGKNISINTTLKNNNEYGHAVTVNDSLDGHAISTLTSATYDPFGESIPGKWEMTAAGKTIKWTATFNLQDRASGYGRLPVSLHVDYGGLQPDADCSWDGNGLLASFTQGPWSLTGSTTGDGATSSLKLVRMYDSKRVSTTWTGLPDGGNTLKRSVAPDGAADDQEDTSVSTTETDFGTAGRGLPGLPHAARYSGGKGASFVWNASPDGSYTLTHSAGLLSASTVQKGIKRIDSVNSHGFPVKTETFFIPDGGGKITGTDYSTQDRTSWGMPRKATNYNTGLAATWTFDGDTLRPATMTSGLGAEATWSGYDMLDRATASTIQGIGFGHVYDAFTVTSTATGTNSGQFKEARDELGRLTAVNSTWNGVTDDFTLNPDASPLEITRSHSLFGNHVRKISRNEGTVERAQGPTLPFGGCDGSALDVETGWFKTTTSLHEQTASYQTNWTDSWGRLRKRETPSTAPGGVDNTTVDYGSPGDTVQSIRIVEASGRRIISEHHPFAEDGEIRRSGVDLDGNNLLGGGDRYVESVTKASEGTVTTRLFQNENGGLREILKTEWVAQGNVTVTTINQGEEIITSTPGVSTHPPNIHPTVSVETHSSKGWTRTETLNSLGAVENRTLTGTGMPDCSLDPNWRADGTLSDVSFSCGGANHSVSFNTDGTLASLTAPGRGNILGGHTISGGVETLSADGVTFTSKLDGTENTVSGNDVIGKNEKVTAEANGLKTTITPSTGGKTTYLSNTSGGPTEKKYDAGNGESCQYFHGGLLEKVSLARGGAITFGYSNDGAKDLVSAAWPQVTSGEGASRFNIAAISETYGYDRAGRVDAITDASGSRAVSYEKGRIAQTVWNTGALAGYKVVRKHDELGRDAGFDLYRGTFLVHSADTTPKGDSDEVGELSSGNLKIALSRNAARRITAIQWGNATGSFAPAATQAWQYDSVGRVTNAASDVAAAPSFAYLADAQHPEQSFDTRGRRLKCATTGGEWSYQYTNGALTRANHPLLGLFTYEFDGIGRRKGMGEGNLSDVLNRMVAWTNSQNKTLTIKANPEARVWVNGEEHQNFDGTLTYAVPLPSGQSFGWVPWHAKAVLEDEGDADAWKDAESEKSGAVWIPPVHEAFTYDDAGNRESSALWEYGWDAKNQLVRARTKACETAAQGWDLKFSYDSEGRRYQKTVRRWQAGVITERKTITYIWDGWNLIYERHQLPGGLTVLERKYIWGPDISGSEGGAGGAGGLYLIRETKGNETTDLYPLYDGSGHVVGLTNSARELLAEYAYGPFGERIHAKGTNAQANPWRYATKYLDEETGLYYFGRRYLDSVTGQWLSREPLGESESLNLYSYCHNDPVNHVDELGLMEISTQGAADEQRVQWLLMQLAAGTAHPSAPSDNWKPFFTETKDFGLFKPYGMDDYRRAWTAVQNSGLPSIRNSEGPLPAFVPKPEMPDVAVRALTLGGPPDPGLADLNSSFVMPLGVEGWALGGMVKGAQITKLLLTGASLERSMLIQGVGAELRTGAMAGKLAPEMLSLGTRTGTMTLNSGGATTFFDYYQQSAARHSAWSLGPVHRGVIVEQAWGHNLPQAFKTFDRFDNGIATSIKSFDLDLPSFGKSNGVWNAGRKAIDAAIDFEGYTLQGMTITPQMIQQRAVRIAIPRAPTSAQTAEFMRLRQYGADNGILVFWDIF